MAVVVLLSEFVMVTLDVVFVMGRLVIMVLW